MSLQVKDGAGKFMPMTPVGVCRTQGTIVRQPGEEPVRPGEKKTLWLPWLFQQRLDKPGKYTFILTYKLADDAPIETAVLPVQVVPLTKRMVEKAIVEHWWHNPEEIPAFVREDLNRHQWAVTDILTSKGYVSAVVKFAKGYTLPPRPEYANPEFWFQEGRYLFEPKPFASTAETEENIVASDFHLRLPPQAAGAAKHQLERTLAVELGFLGHAG
ncbi:MAG TPA: hypothetical protein VNA16_00420 [Abditibacteriaceae bacterium]|nr:hypothetical protein [Abditibacteriaceae bacterium]